MKKTISIFLSVLIFACSLSNLEMAVYFKINQQNITSTLCVNRFKPEKQCAGRCFFKNIFEEKNNHSNPNPTCPNIEDNFKINLFPSLIACEHEYTQDLAGKMIYSTCQFISQSYFPPHLRPPI